MFVIVGFIIVIAGVLLGYTLHEGQVMLLWQPTEFLIIGGAALGGMLIANPLPTMNYSSFCTSFFSSRSVTV